MGERIPKGTRVRLRRAWANTPEGATGVVISGCAGALSGEEYARVHYDNPGPIGDELIYYHLLEPVIETPFEAAVRAYLDKEFGKRLGDMAVVSCVVHGGRGVEVVWDKHGEYALDSWWTTDAFELAPPPARTPLEAAVYDYINQELPR